VRSERQKVTITENTTPKPWLIFVYGVVSGVAAVGFMYVGDKYAHDQYEYDVDEPMSRLLGGNVFAVTLFSTAMQFFSDWQFIPAVRNSGRRGFELNFLNFDTLKLVLTRFVSYGNAITTGLAVTYLPIRMNYLGESIDDLPNQRGCNWFAAFCGLLGLSNYLMAFRSDQPGGDLDRFQSEIVFYTENRMPSIKVILIHSVIAFGLSFAGRAVMQNYVADHIPLGGAMPKIMGGNMGSVITFSLVLQACVDLQRVPWQAAMGCGVQDIMRCLGRRLRSCFNSEDSDHEYTALVGEDSGESALVYPPAQMAVVAEGEDLGDAYRALPAEDGFIVSDFVKWGGACTETSKIALARVARYGLAICNGLAIAAVALKVSDNGNDTGSSTMAICGVIATLFCLLGLGNFWLANRADRWGGFFYRQEPESQSELAMQTLGYEV